MSLYDLFGAVNDWLSNIYSQINLTPYLAADQLWNNIWDKVQWLNTNITSNVTWLYDKILPNFNSIVNGINKILGMAWDALWAFIKDPIGSLQKAWSDIQAWTNNAARWLNDSLNTARDMLLQSLQNGWSWVQTAINDAEAGIRSFVSSGIDEIKASFNSGISQLVADISDLPGTINKFFSDSTATIVNAIPDSLATALDTFSKPLLSSLGGEAVEESPLMWYYTPPKVRTFNLVAGWIYEGVKGVWDFIWTHLIEVGGQIVGVLTAAVNAIKDAFTGFINYVINGITGSLTAGSPPPEIAQPVNVMTQTIWNKQIKAIDAMYHSEPTELATMDTAITTAAGLIGAGILTMTLGSAADLVHPLKDLGIKVTAREAIYWLGIPSVTAAIAIMPTQLGLLVPLQYYLNARWTPRIPDAADLIRFAVRECFVPEELARLTVPGPGDDFYSYMARQGYSSTWAMRYWAAHWVRPSLSDLNNSLYRGIIDDDTWSREVRLNDIAPYAIPWLQKIIFAPYTRVDIRRMWDIGLVTEAEVLENYRWLGYDDEHAARMTLWTKAYTLAADIRALYSKGWINEAGARQMILDAGVPKERADVFMQKLIKSTIVDRTTEQKDLTKTDILRLYKDKLISDSQASSMLQDLGYDASEAAYLISLYTSGDVITIKELTQAQILKAYRLGVYSRDEAKSKLIEEGWSADSAEILLKLEDINKADANVTKQAERDLSRTDIINAINREIIDKQTGHDYLAYMGYSEWEIKVIFALEGIEWPIGA